MRGTAVYGMEITMKTTMDYMIGNTAIQIINTGNKIKVIDVEKRKIRKKFWGRFILVSLLSAILAVTCFYVVQLENRKVLLDKQVYALQAQIEELEKENLVMEKQNSETPIDYQDIFTRARELGMRFPTNQQIQTYTVEKSTAVRLYGN